MKYLDGKNFQKKFLKEVKETINLLGIIPTLAVISINDDGVANPFFKQLRLMCETVGYSLIHYHYVDISEETLFNHIQKLNKNGNITSILIIRPLPKHLLSSRIRNTILPRKDIEGMTDINQIKILNQNGGFLPGTVLGIIHLLEGYHINIKKKNVVIINRSYGIGKPLAQFFLNQDCTVTICHSKTNNLEYYIRNADIVVTAIGKANVLSSTLFKKNSVIIDVGLEYLNGKFYGDVDLINEKDCQIAYFAKSIGGVGPMTIAAIAENILKSYYLNQEDKEKKVL